MSARPSSPRWLNLATAAAVASLYAVLSLWRHATLQSGVDLAIYAQALKGYSQFEAPASTIKAVQPFSLLGDHFTPALALLAPFYKVWPNAAVLLVLQAVLVGLTVYIIAAESERLLGRAGGVAAALVFGLAWGIQGLALFDFHEVALALPLIAMAYRQLLRDRYIASVLWALPLMTVKEDSVFLLLGLALVLAAKREFRLATVTGLAAVSSFALIVGVLIPALSYSGRYTYWSSSAAGSGLVSTIEGAAANVGNHLFSGSGAALVLILFAPTLLLALRSPLILGVLPPLLSRLSSPDPGYSTPWFHYNATVTVVIVLAAVDSVARLAACRSQFIVRRWAVLACAATAVTVALGPASGVVKSSAGACRPCVAEAQQELQQVPTYARVAAHDSLVAYLVDRTTLFGLHDQIRDSTGVLIQPDFIVVDLAAADAAAQVVEARSKGYIPVLNDDGSPSSPSWVMVMVSS